MWKRIGKWLSVILLLSVCVTTTPYTGLAVGSEPYIEADQSGDTVSISGRTGADDPGKVALLVVDAKGQIVYFQDVAGEGSPFHIFFQPAETAANGKAVATLYSKTPVSDTFTLKVPDDDEDAKIGVTLRIQGYQGEEIIAKSSWNIKKGSSVYDLLVYAAEERNLDLEVSDPDGDGHDLYVKSINGLAEFDKGPASGWVYMVNGKGPQAPVDRYILEKGDQVEWLYTSDYGRSEMGDSGGSNTISYQVTNAEAVSVEKAISQLAFAEDVETIVEITDNLLFDLANYDVEKQRGFVTDVGMFLQAAYERAAYVSVPVNKRAERTQVVELTGKSIKELLASQQELRQELEELLEGSTLYKPLLTTLVPTVLVSLPNDQDTRRFQLLVEAEAWNALRQANVRLGVTRSDWRSELLPVQEISSNLKHVIFTVQFYQDQEQTAHIQELTGSWTGTLHPLTGSYRLESVPAGVASYQINWPLTGVAEEGAWPSLFIRENEQAGWQPVATLVDIEKKRAKAIATKQGDMLALSTQAAFQDLMDAPTSLAWAKEPIQALAAVGVIKGKTPLQFGLHDMVTHQEFATMLARVTGRGEAEARQAGSGGITRSEIAVRLAAAYGQAGERVPLSFTDLSAIPESVREAIGLCVAHGWLQGRTDGRFDPHAAITRAEAAAVLYRFWNDQQKKAYK
jgi:hypothetical protein